MQCTWRDRHGRAKLWLPWQHWHGHTRKGGQGSLAEKAYWQRLPPSTLPTGVGFMPTHVSYVLSSASVASGPPLAYRAWRGVLDLSREPRPDLRAKVKKKKKNRRIPREWTWVWISSQHGFKFSLQVFGSVRSKSDFVEQLALSMTPGSKSWPETETTGQSLDGFGWAQSLKALFSNLFIQFPVGVCNFNQ